MENTSIDKLCELFLQTINQYNALEKKTHTYDIDPQIYLSEIHTIVAVGAHEAITVTGLAQLPVSYTHLDVYKRQPLVEALSFGVPVLAYASSAVPSTLGGSGVLLKEKDPILAGEMMHRILSDEALRQQVLQKQKERLQDFSFEAVRALFEKQMSAFLEETKR